MNKPDSETASDIPCGEPTRDDFAWVAEQVSQPRAVTISARLYEELKDYLATETDMTAGQLLRRLRESNNG